MKKKILWLLCMGGLVAYVLFGVRGWAFNQSKFKVQVVPLDCQFDVIDTGTNEIKYLTPVECGIAPAPQEPTDESPSGGTAVGDNGDAGAEDPLAVDEPQKTGQTPGGFDNQTAEQIAPHLRDKGSAAPRTTQDVIILAGLLITASIATDALLLNGWLWQQLSQNVPFLRRRG